jgi:Skp family chaperone for outer membrane proteins
MRKGFFFIFLALLTANATKAQTKGAKVGYIDMEYILQNIPNYNDAQSQLEDKAQIWKQEIEVKKTEITKLKDALKAEKALLTKGLVDERISEIAILENELLEYQQKRFGPNGDLMTQKNGLTKPIQDQVFSIVQDIAETKKYDFIFDKTSDMTMLFAAKRYDISELVIRILNKTEKREQLTKKQLKAEAEKETKEDTQNDNPELAKREQALESKKAARQAILINRKAVEELRRKSAEERKQKFLADKEVTKNGTTTSAASPTESNSANTEAATSTAKRAQADQRAKTLENRKKAAEENRRVQEEKRQQAISERTTKTVNIDQATPSEPTLPEKETELNTSKTTEAAEAKQKQLDTKTKILEDRKRAAEENRKAQEEKRQQVLQARETKKTGTVSETIVKENTNTETENRQITTKVAKPINETATTKEITATTSGETDKQKQATTRAKVIEDRNKIIEDHKKALEERRKKVLQDREVAKKVPKEN